MIINDMEIKIEYTESTDPRIPILSLAKSIDSIEKIDMSLIDSLSLKYSSHYELDGFRTGSIRALFKYLISIPSDEDIKDSSLFQLPVKVFGSYVVEARRIIIETFNRMEENGYEEAINKCQELLYRLFMDSHLNQSFASFGIPHIVIADCYNSLTNTRKNADSVKSITVFDGKNVIKIGHGTIIDLRNIKDDNRETFEDTTILGIKRPDFLDISQWQVVYQGKNTRANFNDTDFLLGFLNRRSLIQPGDSIMANITINKYGKNCVIDIKKVIKVIPPEQLSGVQTKLFE